MTAYQKPPACESVLLRGSCARLLKGLALLHSFPVLAPSSAGAALRLRRNAAAAAKPPLLARFAKQIARVRCVEMLHFLRTAALIEVGNMTAYQKPPACEPVLLRGSCARLLKGLALLPSFPVLAPLVGGRRGFLHATKPKFPRKTPRLVISPQIAHKNPHNPKTASDFLQGGLFIHFIFSQA